MLTQEELKKLLEYNPETGVFVWKERDGKGWNKSLNGAIAGGVNPRDGHVYIRVHGKLYKASRLAWLYINGRIPAEVDHQDLDKENNRSNNLRDATKSQNCANRRVRSDSCSGAKGVKWHPQAKKWWARICKDGKRISLGLFDKDKKHEAIAAYAKAAKEMHGEFARIK